ncbi:penicillin-binding protein [Bacillus sp. 1NLA3E]|uniref:penicillin-binding protein n=1 Tax=Bacillus sp. 1NLA3E TaxID=666686 RepID=UPI000247E3C7|nr:penicillin-binding protein [Bacillus sp. 1NLA3E]AGK52979.1 peptidoglycan glycosyltransferase [Bacillus sp. 1NLA3E]
MIKKQPNMNIGAAILFVIFSLLFFVLLFHYLSMQITGEAHGQVLAAKAQQKYTKESVIDASRGTIYDRKGEVVAKDTTSYKIVAILDKKMTTDPKNPKHVVDPAMTARKLAKYIPMSENEIYKQLSKKGPFQVEFGNAGRDVSHQVKTEIEALKLPGITFMRDKKRFYPNGIFASHLVGFVEKKEEKDGSSKTVGQLGVESTLNDVLTGKNGKVDYESDLWGYLLPDGKEKITPAHDGDDVYLTIDKSIQTFLEDAMNKVVAEYKPQKMIAIVADPKTGEILAMGQRPTFHPKTREGLEKSWRNEAIEDSFEPGSTMKIFTLSAAVNEGAFNPNELYQSGSYKVTPNSKSIHDHNGVGWGTISFLEGVQRSSNVGFARLANEKLGFDKFREYLTKFGFDGPTGIDLPNETSGSIVFRYPIDKVTTAFGQGTAITPIQQIQAATAVANDGKMMKPHVISKIVDPNTGKTIKEEKPEVAGTPISAETAKEVRDILGTVITSPNGTGSRYRIDGYDIAGKTGTAQIPGAKGYLTGAKNYVFSFLGMAPKDDPKLVVYVAVQQPEIESYFDGSIPVSMIFNPVMKNSLQYLNIKPGSVEKAKINTLPNLTQMSIEGAKETLNQKGLQHVIIGDGSTVIEQLPAQNEEILEGEKVVLKTDGNLKMPDLTGWSRRDVMKIAKVAGLKLTVSGTGYVITQNIEQGTVLTKGSYLIVDCKVPTEVKEKSEKDKSKKDTVNNQEVDVQD